MGLVVVPQAQPVVGLAVVVPGIPDVLEPSLEDILVSDS